MRARVFWRTTATARNDDGWASPLACRDPRASRIPSSYVTVFVKPCTKGPRKNNFTFWPPMHHGRQGRLRLRLADGAEEAFWSGDVEKIVAL